MQAAPLIVSAQLVQGLHKLRDVAGTKPVDMPSLMRAIETPRGKRLHMAQMTRQTVAIPGPWPFFVTFSIEIGHPVGVCRHMSMSIKRDGRVPHPEAVWMMAEHLGFSGGLTSCHVWKEQLSDGGIAVNAVQALAVAAGTGRA